MSSTNILHGQYAHIWFTQGLRPAGQDIGMSAHWVPDDERKGKLEIGGGTSEINKDGVAFFAIPNSFLPLGVPGRVDWWIHDGDDFWEPAIASEADGGQGSFEVG